MSNLCNVKTIQRYTLSYEGVDFLQMPAGAVLLHCEMIDSKINVWAMCDPDEQRMEARQFQSIMDGANIPSNGMYLGTCASGEHMIWHIFELNMQQSMSGTQPDDPDTVGELRIGKDTMDGLSDKFSLTFEHECCRYHEDNTVSIESPQSFLNGLDALADVLHVTPETVLRQLIGLKPN